MEVVFRHFFDTRKLMDGKFSTVFPERRRRSEAVIGFFEARINMDLFSPY